MKIVQSVILAASLCAACPIAFSQVSNVTEQQDYSFAIGLYRDGQYDLALRQFNTFLKSYPNTSHKEELTFLSGECLLQKRMFDSALGEFQKIVNDYPNSDYLARANLRIGEIWLEAGKLDRAEGILKELLAKDNGEDVNGEAAYKLGQLFTEREDYNNSIKYFELSYEGYRGSDVADYAMYGSGWSFGKLGEFEKGKNRFAEMLANFPNSKLKADAIEKIGECDFFLGNYESSITQFAEADSISSEDQVKEPARFYEGRAYEKIEENDSAITLYSRYLDAFPTAGRSSEVRLLLSKLLTSTTGRAREALVVLKSIPEGDHFYFDAQLEIARSYQSAGFPDSAESVLIDLVKTQTSPANVATVHFELGKLYFGERKYSKSVESFVISSKDTSLYAGSMKNAAISSAAAGNYENSKTYFANAILKLQGSDLLDAHFDYAASLYASGDYKAAAQIYLAAENLAPSDSERAEALYMAGESFYRARDYSSALSSYQRYVQSFPARDRAAGALLGVGYSNYYLGKFAAGSEAFQKFIDKYPGSPLFPDAILRLGDCYYYDKNYVNALQIYENAASKLSSNSAGQEDSNALYATYQCGECDFWLGKYEDAMNTLQSLVEKYPNSPLAPDAQYAIGWIYFSQKLYSHAIGEFDKLTTNYPGSLAAVKALYSKGDSYYNSGEYQQALMCYSELLSKYPSSGYVDNAIVGMQYCLTVLGRPKEAETVIDNFVRDHPQLPNVDKVYYKKIEYELNQKHFAQAERDLREFIVKFPKSSLSGAALYNLGLVEINLGKVKTATGVLSDLIAKRPGDEYTTAGKVKLAELYESSKGYSEAERLLTEAANAEDVYGVTAQTELGRFYLDRGDTLKAESVLSRISTIDTADDEERAKARVMLSEVYFSRGRTQDAIALANSVAKTRDDLTGAEAQLKVAEYYCHGGDSANAVIAFLRVKYVFASFTDIAAKSQIEYADCLIKFGNIREARVLLQEFVNGRPDDSFTKLAREKLKEIKSN